MSKILLILREFEEQSIKYCSWKNNHELSIAIDGNSDLDLLVDENKKGEVENILIKNEWIEALNTSIISSKVKHYYFIDSDNYFHIHLYYKLYTGHSWLKEYHISEENNILNTAIKDPIFNIFI